MSRDNTAAAGGSMKPDLLTEESSEREKALFRCRMAESAERFDDMVSTIRGVVLDAKTPLDANERNFLSVAYKNAVGSRRGALRCLQAFKQKYEHKGPNAQKNVEEITEYCKKVREELNQICRDILELVDKHILSQNMLNMLNGDRTEREFLAFFHKMKGDYYRYIAEFALDDEKAEVIQAASDSYKTAMAAASEGPPEVRLPPPHPIRLGLSLNYSVFLYEIQEQPELAKATAKTAFEEALATLDQSSEVDYKDSTLILQLLRDNTTLWTSQDADVAAQAEPAAAPAPAPAAAAAKPEGGADQQPAAGEASQVEGDAKKSESPQQ